jgi:mono/diheme cytochrome c family protein
MDYLGLSILIALALLFGFLTYRAVRARRLWVKLAGGIPAGLLTLLFGAATGLAFVGYSKLNATYANPPSQLQLATLTTAQLVADGERHARFCAACHSSTGQLPLDGKDLFAGEDIPPIGTVWASNLTPAHLGEWSDGELIRAIREGVGRDGKALLAMPSAAFRHMSDDDVLALVAYLRAQPAVGTASPPKRINVLGAIMIATVFPPEIFGVQPPITEPVIAPPRGPTSAYGGYLVANLACQDCHGSNLAGVGTAGGFDELSPNLTNLPQRMSVEQFVALLRTGNYEDGRTLSEGMPWQDYEKYSDDDFRAMYAYLTSLEPLADNE